MDCLFGAGGTDKGQFVHDLLEVGQQLGDFAARFAVAGKGIGTAQDAGLLLCNLFEPLSFDIGGGDRLAVKPVERRFVVEQVEVARTAHHEQVDHPFGCRWKMAGPHGQGVAGRGSHRCLGWRVSRQHA